MNHRKELLRSLWVYLFFARLRVLGSGPRGLQGFGFYAFDRDARGLGLIGLGIYRVIQGLVHCSPCSKEKDL